MCKSADLLLMVLDASKPHGHREILTRELESVGVRLNRRPPSIYFKKKKTGGISFSSVVPLTRMDEKLCQRILQVRKSVTLRWTIWFPVYSFNGMRSNHGALPSSAVLRSKACRSFLQRLTVFSMRGRRPKYA